MQEGLKIRESFCDAIGDVTLGYTASYLRVVQCDTVFVELYTYYGSEIKLNVYISLKRKL